MFRIIKNAPDLYVGDMIVYFVRQAAKGGPISTNGKIQAIIDRAYSVGDFLGREGETLLHYPETQIGNQKYTKRMLVIGMGKEDACHDLFRRAGGTVATSAMKTKSKKILVVLPEFVDFDKADMAQSLTEGITLGVYTFKKYKTKEDPDELIGNLKEVGLYATDPVAARQGMKQGRLAASASCVVRDMANEPGNLWTPASFAEYAEGLAKKYKFKLKTLSENDMKKLGMGGILGVSQGSVNPPKMVILEYKTSGKRTPTLLLVGKGLTFDTGGISLKQPLGMEDMKYDMCGGAAVLAAMQAVGELKPKRLNIVAIVPAAENMPGPAALKPGDVIRQYGGKTVEVVNTDAEGRLILADALAYGIEKYKPRTVIDIATLTGAVIIGLGHHRTGLLSNNDELAAKLAAAGEKSGEPLWRLPLGKEYTKMLKSEIADMKNVGKREAGTIVGASFLQEFVGDTAWGHLDIAGTAWNFTEKSYCAKGPSGTGARTFIEYIREWL